MAAEVAADALAASTSDDELSMLVRYFEEAESGSQEARADSERCRDYYNHAQYTSGELAALKKRGQAPVIDNFVQRKVDTLCGIERRTRTDPKAFPRTPSDEDAANAATDALRYVADQNRFNSVCSEVFNDILVEGTGAAEISVEETRDGDRKVTAKRVPWDRLFWDPHSRALNFADAAYKGIVIWSDAADAYRDYPGRDEAIDNTLSLGISDTYDDRPRLSWCDSKRKRVRIVQIHYLADGQWMIATFTKGGFLVDPVQSPYVDKYGEPVSGLVMRSGFVDRENRRYGHCKGLLSLQDEINKRRSKALHLLSVRQSYGNKSGIQDVAKAKAELAKPDGHVEINGGAQFGKDFGILPTGDMAQGQVMMYEQALQSMNATGANSALQGKDNAAPSGVALQTKIQAGATELEPQTDGLREWKHEAYEAMWMRIRQFWDSEKWIRVTDDDRNIKWVGLNKQVTLQDKLAQMQPEEAQMLMQQYQLQPGDPRLQQVVEVENDVSGLDIDLVIDESPDMAVLQGEQFKNLVDLASSPMAQGQIPFTAIIKASSLRNKDQILDEMEQAQQQSQQAHQQQLAEAHQAGMEAHAAAQAETAAKLKKLEADTGQSQAKTEQILIESHINGMTALQQALNGTLAPPAPPPQSAQQPATAH